MGCAELTMANVHQVTQEELWGWFKHATRQTRHSWVRLPLLPINCSSQRCLLGQQGDLLLVFSAAAPVAEESVGWHLFWVLFHPLDFDIGTCSSLQPGPSTGSVLVHPSLPCSTVGWTWQIQKGPGAWRIHT